MKIDNVHIQNNRLSSERGSLSLFKRTFKEEADYMIVSNIESNNQVSSMVILSESQVIELIQKLEMLLG
jgi:hypothetical protein